MADATTDVPQARRSRARLVLVGLFAIFFLPITVALVLNVVAPGWMPFGQVNHGELVVPPRAAGLADALPVDGGPAPASGAEAVWMLVHVSPGPCDADCRRALVKIRQARLALGKDASRVARWWLMTDAADARTVTEVAEQHPGLRMGHIASGSPLLGAGGGSVQLVDPAGLLILRYAADHSTSAIFKDLKRLLKISKHG